MTVPSLAIVVIGRNEGLRLVKCLQSAQGRAALLIYVDSGSSDGSVQAAQSLGAAVVQLDLTIPFTAARARNAGWHRALELVPEVRWIQFVDGDCEILPGWIERAWAHLDSNPRAAAVCGQQRERYPQNTVYNRLCDLEWQVPPGVVLSCGGSVMMRVDALVEVRGYRDDMIAGEEPELCVRLRARGWLIHALPDAMTLHDAAINRIGQWWQRIRRSGYAYAQGAHLHGASPERHYVREVRRAWTWGLVLPLAILIATLWLGPWALLAVAIYPLQVLRLYFRGAGLPSDRAARALFQTLGRFPEMFGLLQFLRDRLLRRRSGLIEYK
jgi:glycosyltransferase involved in cell wall biosynthesis